jgi:hypothetical protein
MKKQTLRHKVAYLLIAYLVISNCKQIQKYSTDRLQNNYSTDRLQLAEGA